MDDGRPPVLLVPGFSGQDLIYWNVMHHRFERGGFRVFTTTFPWLTMRDMRLSAEQLAKRIEEVLGATGWQSLHLMGHSMGGLIMRHAIEHLGAHEHVASAVTIGTPHQGTVLGLAVAPTRAGRQLLPGSSFLRQLGPGPGRIPLLNLHAGMDMIVMPPANAVLPQGNNVRLRVTGHWSLLVRRPVYRHASAWFRQHPAASR